jgi:hypothetical protein
MQPAASSMPPNGIDSSTSLARVWSRTVTQLCRSNTIDGIIAYVTSMFSVALCGCRVAPLAAMRRIASFIPILLLASLAQAVTLQILTLDEMTQKSTSVVYAKVLDSYGALHGSMIYTHYRIQVMENWKGSQAVTEIMLPGGVANGYRQTFAGVPALSSGNAYVMFLWAGPVGAPQLVGLTQGLLDVGGDAKSGLIASRPMTTEQLLDANGKAAHDQPVRLQLASLKRTVTMTLNAAKGVK